MRPSSGVFLLFNTEFGKWKIQKKFIVLKVIRWVAVIAQYSFMIKASIYADTRKKCWSLIGAFALCYLVVTYATVTAFLCIDSVFNGVMTLGVALSLRTLSTAIFSLYCKKFLREYPSRKLILFSQICLVFFVGILTLGFLKKNIYLTMMGFACIGLPMALLAVMATSYFKSELIDENSFREFSGRRELIASYCRLIICIISPITLLFLSPKEALLSGFIFSMFALLVFLKINIPENLKIKKNNKEVFFKPSFGVLRKKETWKFTIILSSSIMLIAFIALMAGSNDIPFTRHLSSVTRRLLWSVEAIAMISGSFFYTLIKKHSSDFIVSLLLSMNAFPLLWLLYSTSLESLIIVNFLISFLVMLSFCMFRDNYLVSAGEHINLIEEYAGFSHFYRDIIATVSPIVLTILLTHLQPLSMTSLILFFQVCCFIVYRFL